MTEAFVGLGSNLGDRIGNLARAVDEIAHIPDTRVSRVSHAYDSEPAEGVEQPVFANAVVAVDTALSAPVLLEHLHDIEARMGRIRSGAPSEDRVIDLDLLLVGDEEWTPESGVHVPHPRLSERDFVVVPLLEIAPDVTLPDGSPVSRGTVTTGAVLGDLGEIPDAGDAHGASIVGDWVRVAEIEDFTEALQGWSGELSWKAGLLEEDGIPVVWDPYDPAEERDPLNVPRRFYLMVPADRETDARALLAQAEDSKPLWDEADFQADGEGARADDVL